MRKMEKVFLGEYDGKSCYKEVDKFYSDVSGKELEIGQVYHIGESDCSYEEAFALLGAELVESGTVECSLCGEQTPAEAFEVWRLRKDDNIVVCESCIYNYITDNYKI